MRCPNCGAGLDDYARKCNYCGYSISYNSISSHNYNRLNGGQRREPYNSYENNAYELRTHKTPVIPFLLPMVVGILLYILIGWVVLLRTSSGRGPFPDNKVTALAKNSSSLSEISRTITSTAKQKEISSKENTSETAGIPQSTFSNDVLLKRNVSQLNNNVVVNDSKKNAIEKAQSYIRFMPFSRKGLIEQLEYNSFSYEDAEYGVDQLGIDWKEQALKKGQSYINMMAFSRKDLIEQLEHDGFSNEEAVYAVDQLGINWKEQALRKGQSYINMMAFSRKDLIEQLEHDGFTNEEAVYAVDKLELNGTVQALKSAQSYLKMGAFSRRGLIEQLEYEGFSNEEAVYGADNIGADWYEQAEKSAAEYLKMRAFSREDLIDQLEYEGFSSDQAEYGVSKNGL